MKNNFPNNFVNKYFKGFMDNIFIIKETYKSCNETYCLIPSIHWFNFFTRYIWKRFFCKLKVAFTHKARLGNTFNSKDHNPTNFWSIVIYKFPLWLSHESYYGESMIHLNVTLDDHSSIPPFPRSKYQSKNNFETMRLFDIMRLFNIL